MKKIMFLAFALLLMGGSMRAQETIALPQPEVGRLSMTLGEALQKRRSLREYQTDKEVDLQTLSTLLWAACGISDPATGKAAIIDSVLDFDQASGCTGFASADAVIEYVQ